MITLTNTKTYQPFWDNDKQETYKTLSWNDDYETTKEKINTSSKFSIDIIKLSLNNDHHTFKVKDNNEEEITLKTKSRKLKLRPTKEQKIILNKWAGCTRFLYNKTIAMLTNKKNTIKHKYALRARFATVKHQKTNKPNSFYNNKPWLKECLSSIRKSVIYQAKANLQACFTNLREKNIDHFSAPYRTKKKEQMNGYSYTIEKQDIKKINNELKITTLGTIRYYGTKQLHKLIPNDKPKYDFKIQKTGFGEYFLIIPYEIKQKTLPTKFKNPVSIDPGVRKTYTTYAPNEKTSYILGDRMSNELMKMLIPLDKLYSQRTNDKSKKLKDKIINLRKRIYYFKKEFHHQTANFLTKKYDLIVIPKLETNKLSEKATRRLKTKTVRNMLSLGHAECFKHIQEKSLERGVKFLHVEESYTSQTCPKCGHRKKTSLETYTCTECAFTADRDVVGALNILLKALNP